MAAWASGASAASQGLLEHGGDGGPQVSPVDQLQAHIEETQSVGVRRRGRRELRGVRVAVVDRLQEPSVPVRAERIEQFDADAFGQPFERHHDLSAGIQHKIAGNSDWIQPNRIGTRPQLRRDHTRKIPRPDGR